MKQQQQIILLASSSAAFVAAFAIAITAIIRYYKASKINEQTMQQFQNKDLPRGYRNNNPLNIRISANRWRGKVSPNTDGTFEQFSSMAYGFRAAIKTIQTYIRKYECNTLRSIIQRWAPPTENDTTSYINNVSKRTGIQPDVTITPTDHNAIINIVYAMAISENGYSPNKQDIETAWAML